MSRNRASRSAERTLPTSEPTQPGDHDKIYQVQLTGRDIDELGKIFDAVIRGSGMQCLPIVMPLVEKITAPRVAASA